MIRFFKNNNTGIVWPIENERHMKQLLNDPTYTEVTDEACKHILDVIQESVVDKNVKKSKKDKSKE